MTHWLGNRFPGTPTVLSSPSAERILAMLAAKCRQAVRFTDGSQEAQLHGCYLYYVFY
jgi:hypothetical protein